MDTLALALLLLRTYTTANGRECGGLLEHLGGSENLATLDVLDERRDIDIHRATFDARWLGAVETTLCLAHCHLFGESLVYFFRAGGCTIYRV